MGYLGSQSTFTGTQNNKRISVTATAGQVNFLPSGGYSINAIDVYRNGVKLVGQRDFIALDGVTVTFTQAANENDIIEFVIFENFAVNDVLTGDGDQVVNGNFQVSGDLTIGGILAATVDSTVKAGIATEAIRAGMSTEATRAGIATEAVSAGIATAATYTIGYLGVGVTGTNLNVTGVITASSFSGDGSALTGIAATDNVSTSTLVVAGVSTLGVTNGIGTVTIGTGLTALHVDGNARVVGILTVGSGSITFDPTGNVVTVGSGVVIEGGGGLALTGVMTATSFAGSGANLTTLNASNISSGTIDSARVPTLNQNTTGNAASATALQTARTINGISFDGSANIVTNPSSGAYSNGYGTRTVQSGGSPSGGSDGDIYYIY